MSTPAPHTPQDTPAAPPTGAHRHTQALDTLIEVGTSFARLLHAQALAEAAPPAPAPHPAPAPAANTLLNLAAAFDRTARAVRRCIALARTLDAAPPAPNPAQHRTAARKRILRAVEDTIGRTANDGPDTPDALRAELRDRLDAPDLEDDIATRPAADIVQEICRDLGLAAHPGTQPYQRRTPADVARLCATAAAPKATGPHGPASGTAQPPTPQPPALREPGVTHPGTALPTDPAEAVTLVMRHQHQDRWRPPPG